MAAFFAVIYTLVIPGMLVALVPWLLLRGQEVSVMQWYQYAGWLLVAAGVSLITACTG